MFKVEKSRNMSQKIIFSKLLAVFMVMNILLVSFISVPVVLADPNLENQGQTSNSIQKTETITLWADWSTLPDPPIYATLFTNKTGSWEAYKTIAPGDDGWGALGIDTDFTLTPNDFYNWSTGPIGWYIVSYSLLGNSTSTSTMSFDLCSRSEVESISPSDRSSYVMGSTVTSNTMVNEVVRLQSITGYYYDNMDFTDLKTVRNDTLIDFNWGNNIPTGTAITDDETYSVKWIGKIYIPTSENYTFYVESDDGAMLDIDGIPVIYNWYDYSGANETSSTVNISNGYHDINISFFRNETDFLDGAKIKVSWSNESTSEEVIPESYWYHEYSQPIQSYPVNFYISNSSMEQFIGTSYTNASGQASIDLDTIGFSEGTYYLKSNITNDTSRCLIVTEENETSAKIFFVDEVVDLTLRGRKYYGGLLAGGAEWTNIRFTGGKITHPTLPKVYNVTLDIGIDGDTLETQGKHLNFVFFTYNLNIIEDLGSLNIWGLAGALIRPAAYISGGIWIGDNVLAGGFGLTSLLDFLLSGGLVIWFASSAEESEPFLQWLSQIGLGDELRDLPSTYPAPPASGNIVEFCTEIVYSVIGVIDVILSLQGVIVLLESILNLVSSLLSGLPGWLVNIIKSLAEGIFGILDIANLASIIGMVLGGIIDMVQAILSDFIHFSNIAVIDHTMDVIGLFDAIADRLPDMVGPVDGTYGLTYLMNNTGDVPRPILQDLVDSLLSLIAMIDTLLPRIVSILGEILGLF